MAQKSSGASKALIVFFIQPFLGFLMSLRHLSTRTGKFVFIAFATLWGYCQSFTYTPTDGYRIAARFCQYPVNNFSDIFKAFSEGKAVDIYLLFTNYIVHSFSSNPKVYFAILGLVFGLFCCETISSLVKEQVISDKHLILLLVLLFSTNSFSWLTAPRFFTASWLAAMIFLKISRKQKYWVLLALFLPLIHFSFLPISLVLIVAALSKSMLSSFPGFLYILVMIVFVLSFILPETVIAGLIPQEALDDSSKLASKYTYVDGIHSDRIIREYSAYREANMLITNLFHLAMKIGSFLILSYLYLKRNLIKKHPLVWDTFIMVLIVAIGAFFMSIIPSSGWRYIIVLWLFIYVLLHRYYNIFRPAKFSRVILFLYAINVYTIAFMFYVAYRTVDLILFYAPLPFVIVHGLGFGPISFV